MANRRINTKRESNARQQLYIGGKPALKVSRNKKYAKDFVHSKDIMDYFIASTYFQDSTNKTVGAGGRDIYTLYDAYNNIFSDNLFEYVTNPLSTSKDEHKSWPARIRPYSILRPNLDLLLGEFEKRPKNFIINVNNADAVNMAEEKIQGAIMQSLEQMFLNEVEQQQAQAQGQAPPQQEQPELPKNIKAAKLANYKDARAEQGEIMLNQLEDDLVVKEIWSDCFKDYTIAGETYTYKDVEFDEVIYERVSPLDIDYDKSPGNKYVEAASWVVRRKYMSPTDVVGKFWDELKPDDIDDLEASDQLLPYTSQYFNALFGNTYRVEEDLKRSKIPLYHVVWKYYKKVGFLTFIDEMGQQQEIEVPEGYKPDKEAGESVEWVYGIEWWEGWRADIAYKSADASTESDAGLNGGLYLGVGPTQVQRTKMNNMFSTKGPYNGFRFSDTHSRNVSLVEIGLPYQILYIILHYRLEMTIAKSKGKIALLDINTIPNKLGEEKFFYYAEANGFAMIDRNQMGVDKTWNQYQVLDLDLFQTISNLIGILDQIKQEWDDVLGITRQRKGQVAASETASGVDAARYQSSVISERYFSKFDDFIRVERQGLLDCSKFAYKDGKKALYYTNDERAAILDLDAGQHMEADYNVHVVNSATDIENMKLMKEQTAAFASQGQSPLAIAEVAEAHSISKLKKILKTQQMEAQEASAAAAKSEQEAAERAIKIEQEFKQIEHTFELELQEAKYDREEALAHIKGQYALADTDTPGDELDPLAVQANTIKAQEVADKSSLEQQKIISAEKMAKEKNDTERYKADLQLKVAKENKNKHDTPKSK